MDIKKRIAHMLLALVFTLSFFSLAAIPVAASNPDFNGDTTGTGGGTAKDGDNVWKVFHPNGDITDSADGLRIYVVERASGIKVGTKTLDITNYDVPNNTRNFGGTKNEYMRDVKNATLGNFNRSYTPYHLTDEPDLEKLPPIIGWEESGNAAAYRLARIKDYFLKENNKNSNFLLGKIASSVNTANEANFDYVKWLGKNDYLLAFEPIAYFRYAGNNYALTATEAAKLNQSLGNNDLRNKMSPLTASALPKSVYLEKPMAGINEPGAVPSGNIDDGTIISTYGIGFLSKDDLTKPGDPPNVTLGGNITAYIGSDTNNKQKIVPDKEKQLGDNVTIETQIKPYDTKGADYQAWEKRLDGAKDIKVTFSLKRTTPTAVSIPGGTVEFKRVKSGNYSYSDKTNKTLSMTTEQFLEFLRNGEKITWTDKVASMAIADNQTITFTYTMSLKVEWTDGEKWTTKGEKQSKSIKEISASVKFIKSKTPPPPAPSQEAQVTYVSGDPKAFAELKNGYIHNENFEAMAGTVTTEPLYFAVGGTEFVVDFAGQLIHDAHGKRTYDAYYTSVDCEHKSGDQAGTISFPGGYSTTGHDGATFTKTWTGSVPNKNTASVTALHSATASANPDLTAYNAAMIEAQKFAEEVNKVKHTHTAVSDKITRTKTGWGAGASGSWNLPDVTVTVPCSERPEKSHMEERGSGENKTMVKVIDEPAIPCGNEMATANPVLVGTYTITVTWTVSAHTNCGPCCEHILPTVHDTWTAEFDYDYFDIQKAYVWRLEEGKIVGMSEITAGTDEFTALTLQNQPSIFVNIAATETSAAGRFRYSIEPQQHDSVKWNLGTRANNCDKQTHPIIQGKGILYNNGGYPHEKGYLEKTANAIDKSTREYSGFLEKRKLSGNVTVVSDLLILQTNGGDQSLMYFQKPSNSVQADDDYSPIKASQSEVWSGNGNSAANWQPNTVNVGGYNGKYSDPANKYQPETRGGTVSTIFDSDPARSITRPVRPAGRELFIAKNDIDIIDTLPNDDYASGGAVAVWNPILSHDERGGGTVFDAGGFERTAVYSPEHYAINDIVIHDPVSSEYSMILSIDPARDQRSAGSAKWSEILTGGLPNPAPTIVLDCHYEGEHEHSDGCYIPGAERTPNIHVHDLNCIDGAKLAKAFDKVITTTNTPYSFTGTKPSSGWIGHNNSVSGYVDLPYNATWTVTASINTETSYDFVYLNGNKYSGNQAVSFSFAGTRLSWQFTTDGSVDSVGFAVTSISTVITTTVDTGKFVGEAQWGLTNINSIKAGATIAPTQEWLEKQSLTALAYILGCNNLPLNTHICDASCDHDNALICTEPHHFGGHYDDCYKESEANIGRITSTSDGTASEGYFLNPDWGFQIYFPTIGNFFQSNALGIPSLTQIRGIGYTDQMETKTWVDKKIVRFGFDVIYCGETAVFNPDGSQHGGETHKHTSSCVTVKAGEWFNLPKDFELFNFYLPASDHEMSGAKVEFKVIAINDNGFDNEFTYESTNRNRRPDFTANHGALKNAYTDIVGRIGRLILEDTGDWRFMNLFKMPKEPTQWRIQNIVKEADKTKKNYVLTDLNDLRGENISEPFYQATYGVLDWLKERTLPFPLTPDKNNINALKNQPLRVGYPLYMDISTLAADYTRLTVLPKYYYFDPKTASLAPLDVYMSMNGGYVPINLYGNLDGSKIYDYRVYLDWAREELQRNVNSHESTITEKLSALLSTPNVGGMRSSFGIDKVPIGNAQIIALNENARTYAGSETTLGEAQNIDGKISAESFEAAVKRWHFTLQLPSSAVFVDKGTKPTAENIKKYDNGNELGGYILLAADIFAHSELNILHYENPTATVKIDGKNYTLPNNPDGRPVPPIIAVLGGDGATSADDFVISKTH